jgi:KDO2-lipid IV(A) lauroyltransferase
VSLANLRRAFPGRWDEGELRVVVRDVYQHFAMLLLEMLLMPRKVTPGTWRKRVALPAYEEFEGYFFSGRPVLLVTAHFGNWEMAGYCLGLMGATAHIVARPLDNPYLQDLVARFRESTGSRLLGKHGDLRQMRAVLDWRETLATLGDQDAGPRGMFVDFFGWPASTHRVIAHLALHSGAVIVVAGGRNTGGLLRYRIEVPDVILPEEYAGHPDAERAVTERVSKAIENMVRLDPRQYFWLHRRWHHRPPESRQVA